MDPLPLRSGETSRLTEPPAHFPDGQSEAPKHHRPHLPPTSQTWPEVVFLSTLTPGPEESGVAAWSGPQTQVGFRSAAAPGWRVGGWSLLIISIPCYLSTLSLPPGQESVST